MGDRRRTAGRTAPHIAGVPLTPGPLVIVLKCPEATQKTFQCWPPQDAILGGSIEAVAASYTPEPHGAKLRLFNLGEGIGAASLARDGTPLAGGITFGLGSEWDDVPLTDGEFTVSSGGAAVATRRVAPRDQEVLTLWLLGSNNATQPAFAPRLLPFDDAPHNGAFCTSNLTAHRH